MVRVSCRVRIRFHNSHLSRKSRTASYLAMRHIWHDTGSHERTEESGEITDKLTATSGHAAYASSVDRCRPTTASHQQVN